MSKPPVAIGYLTCCLCCHSEELFRRSRLLKTSLFGSTFSAVSTTGSCKLHSNFLPRINQASRTEASGEWHSKSWDSASNNNVAFSTTPAPIERDRWSYKTSQHTCLLALGAPILVLIMAQQLTAHKFPPNYWSISDPTTTVLAKETSLPALPLPAVYPNLVPE